MKENSWSFPLFYCHLINCGLNQSNIVNTNIYFNNLNINDADQSLFLHLKVKQCVT